MIDEKDIRFSEKKVDDSWKEQIEREKGAARPSESQAAKKDSSPKPTSKPFLSLLNSLVFQAMMHLGEIPNPETREGEVNLEAAKEVIELLLAVRSKSLGNTSPEETEFLNSALSELQLKFSGKI
jgi:hypothetical protein